MENRIPLPTDNIFKFYALFGLLLFIFSAGLLLYSHRSANQVIIDAIPELEELKSLPEPLPVHKARVAILERQIEITKSDRGLHSAILGCIGGVAVLLIGYGFREWHSKVQPVLDRTAKAQMEIAEIQLKKLQREFEVPSAASIEPGQTTQQHAAATKEEPSPSKP